VHLSLVCMVEPSHVMAAWDRAEQASYVALSIQEVKSFRVSRHDSLMVLCKLRVLSGVHMKERSVNVWTQSL